MSVISPTVQFFSAANHLLIRSTFSFQSVVQSVLQRVEDVQEMCEKRRNSLKRLAAKINRPVQPVSPEPQIMGSPSGPHSKPPVIVSNLPADYHKTRSKSLPANSPCQKGHERSSSGNRLLQRTRTDGNGSDTSGSLDIDPECIGPLGDSDILAAKRGHVMRELIDTERMYVQELRMILEGYCDEMENPYMQQLLPVALKGKQDILFGNMREIYNFHSKYVSKDLQ